MLCLRIASITTTWNKYFGKRISIFAESNFDKNMKRQESASLPTKYGEFEMITFKSEFNDFPHVVLFSKTDYSDIPAVRVHSECMTGDVFSSGRCDCGEQLDAAMEYVAKYGGLIIYLRQEGRGIGLNNKLLAYNLQDQGYDTYAANEKLGLHQDNRNFTIAADILKELSIQKINLLTNNPDKVQQLKESGIKIEKRIPIEIKALDSNRSYLQTKKDQKGHILDQFSKKHN